jgi:hypothetical protein
MIKMDFGGIFMSCTQVFEWFHWFEEGQLSVESDAQQKGCSQFRQLR